MSQKLMQRFSLEDNNETTEAIETEIIVYSKVSDPEGLKQATSIEHHLQIDSRFENGNRCRVRCTTSGDDVKYEFTYKVNTSEEQGVEANREYTVKVDKDFFEGFKSNATCIVDKTRYKFISEKIELVLQGDDEKKIIEVPDISYEVDVYKKSTTEVSEWCKIDIEIDNIINFLSKEYPDIQNFKLNVKISHLPFKPTESILSMSMTEEQKVFIDSLWTNEYNLAPKDT